MKRKNNNKRQPKWRKRKVRFVNVMPVLIAAMGASQIANIASSPIPKFISGNDPFTLNNGARNQKSINIASIVLDAAIAVVKIAKDEKQLRFKLTGRYTGKYLKGKLQKYSY